MRLVSKQDESRETRSQTNRVLLGKTSRVTVQVNKAHLNGPDLRLCREDVVSGARTADMKEMAQADEGSRVERNSCV